MKTIVTGLHHITALASDAQKNLDFYSGILGLRLVKKTINFDDPAIYHLYYGNESGEPGTILTFFPYPGIPKGRKGTGQLTATAFSIPGHAMEYWMKRLNKFHISYQGPDKRFNECVLSFEDDDGLGLELVANKTDDRPGFTYGNIPSECAIRGLYGITLSEECYEKTAALLTKQMGHVILAEEGSRFRFSTAEKPGSFVDVLCSPDALRGLTGSGTVHHVAFATPTDVKQQEAHSILRKAGLNVTPVLDRNYFHSIYFREPGGVLFEIATVPPGFLIDEPLKDLGKGLKLPPWEERNRERIEKKLLPIKLKLEKFRDG